jgi:hypothetical protein
MAHSGQFFHRGGGFSRAPACCSVRADRSKIAAGNFARRGLDRLGAVLHLADDGGELVAHLACSAPQLSDLALRWRCGTRGEVAAGYGVRHATVARKACTSWRTSTTPATVTPSVMMAAWA